MIITLIKADFSDSNIGSSTTWRITKTLKGVTCSNSATTITKGSTYSATFTVTSGYTFSSATVTMGGVDKTSSLVWNNEKTSATLSLTTTETSGNIYITITALSESGSDSGSGNSGEITWSLGVVIDASGNESSNTLWATSDFIEVPYNIAQFTNPNLQKSNGISHNIICYDINSNFIGRVVEPTAEEGATSITRDLLSNTRKIRVVMGHPSSLGNSSAMTLEETKLYAGTITGTGIPSGPSNTKPSGGNLITTTWSLGKVADASGNITDGVDGAISDYIDVSGYNNPCIVVPNLQDKGIAQNVLVYNGDTFMMRSLESVYTEPYFIHTLDQNATKVRIVFAFPTALGHKGETMTSALTALFAGEIVEQ